MAIEERTGGTTRLWACLEDFQQKFNTNPRARKLVKNWTRQIMLEATDSGEICTMVIADEELQQILPGRAPNTDDDFLVHLQAEDGTLVDIFSGVYNPSNALLDGLLSVYSNDKDKVKLEALALVIWGL